MDNLTELLRAINLELYDTGNVEARQCVAALEVMIRRMRTAERRSEDLELGLMQVKSLMTVRSDTSATDIKKLHVNVREFIVDLLQPNPNDETKPMEVFDGYGT